MLTLSKKVREELSTVFNDPQVISVAITNGGKVIISADFRLYGLNETGIYRCTPSIKPLHIFKGWNRIVKRDAHMQELVRRTGATLIKSRRAMEQFLKRLDKQAGALGNAIQRKTA